MIQHFSLHWDHRHATETAVLLLLFVSPDGLSFVLCNFEALKHFIYIFFCQKIKHCWSDSDATVMKIWRKMVVDPSACCWANDTGTDWGCVGVGVCVCVCVCCCLTGEYWSQASIHSVMPLKNCSFSAGNIVSISECGCVCVCVWHRV